MKNNEMCIACEINNKDEYKLFNFRGLYILISVQDVIINFIKGESGMKRLIGIVVVLIMMMCTSPVNALEIGDTFRVTGCENGVLYVPTINVWSEPGGIANGARVVGRLSGGSSLCAGGSLVKLLGYERMNGRLFLRIEDVITGTVGWITDSFIY